MPRKKYAELSFSSWDALWNDSLFSKPLTTVDPTVPHFTIDNVVATFTMADKVDLEQVARKLYFLEYNCSKFTAATLRLKQPATTALTFSSGSVVCTGAKSIEAALQAAHIYVDIFRRVIPHAAVSNFKIQNLVANAKCPFTVDLVGILRAFSAHATFSIDVFPGLVFRFDSPKIVFLVFRSGSVVITGARNMQSIADMFKKFYTQILFKYKDTTEHAHISNSSEYKDFLGEGRVF